VAILATSGEVTARQVPRTWMTRSDAALTNDEPPKESPTMTVMNGTRRARRKSSTSTATWAKPAEPSESGMRAPPVAPK